jgi:hypothetical protein
MKREANIGKNEWIKETNREGNIVSGSILDQIKAV